MDDSVNKEDCLTDTDSGSHEYSYSGKSRPSYRMRRKRASQPLSTAGEVHDNGIDVLGTKSNMFRDLDIRKGRISRKKQSGIIKHDNNSPNINDLLSTEILLKIFSYLCNPREISLKIYQL